MSLVNDAIATPLSTAECVSIAHDIAAQPDIWKPCVRHNPGQRYFQLIDRDQQREIYVICWMDDHDTGFHDHDISCGAVHVVEGGIFEERLGFGSDHIERLVGPGETIRFAPSYIHRFRPKDGIPTVTVHVYSPPLQTIGAYHRGGDGALIRTPVDGAAELINIDR